ncbi:MAG: putative toxin-antitoxin system toxin component, PIN family [Nitrospirae bacterium]|nr:putative toxin-antitoxin system toxin component, PIN family [Nitrospirota bacterium]
MGKGEKVVIDTNIFISAFGWGGNPLHIIELLEQKKLINCTSEEILNELNCALSYPKLDFPQKLQTYILEFVLAHSNIYKTEKHLKIATDPGDNKFLECAVSANAKFIITGDKKLLSIKQFKNVKITNADDFLKERNYK